MTDARASIRTPRARIKGLGASGHGAGHFWLQRLTAAANVPLVVAVLAVPALLASATLARLLTVTEVRSTRGGGRR